MTRGSSTNYPFKPGGFDDAENELMEQFKSGKAEDTSDVWRELNDRSRFIKVPPGFDRGYEFPGKRYRVATRWWSVFNGGKNSK